MNDDIIEESVENDDLPTEFAPIVGEAMTNFVKESKPGKFIVALPNEEDEKLPEAEVGIDKEEESGFSNLPKVLETEFKNAGFTKKDTLDNPLSVLETITLMRRQKTGSVHPLPTNSEYRKVEKENITFIKSNPAQDYLILEELGEGGFGKVYKCTCNKNSDIFAMKYIDITSSKQKIYIGNEITIMKTTDNPNVVKLYDVYLNKGRIFMIMDYLDGGWLTPIVEDHKEDIPENVIAFILREVLQGIACLHKRGIVHRDIKSDNILIEKGSSVIKLTDFGYSCQLTQEKRMRESRVGTLYWMAPEILKGNNKYDERWDIWSFGIFAFELAQGFPPFPKKGQQKTIYEILSNPSPTLAEPEKWSEDFNSFIEWWMVKNFEDRPTAFELLKHPFIHENLDYETARQDYMDFKEKYLQMSGAIPEDFERNSFSGFDTQSNKRKKSNAVKKKI